MVKINYYSGLNPVVVQAITNLYYRYSNKTPKMWYFRIRIPFRKLIEYSPTFFSKNEYIYITKKLYENGEFKAGRRSFYIYCTRKGMLHNINLYRKSSKFYCSCTSKEIKKSVAYQLINSAKVIQRTWRTFKLRPEI
ncbi:hypothetical protein RhiirA1_477778 [Rhizophagus irregularis]|uniref:Uncharacterized protein n=1 Tax=Rhizophagus irregularis TaxID=588596 RepID=A0A2N0QT37_9GLOM|nr:hypothetical protein RhiirA1_477778 [Rhizophagus irregularis]